MFEKWLNDVSFLPDEIDKDLPLIYNLGQNKIKILNYKKVLHYNSGEMVLLLKKQMLIIQGKQLDIEYFNEDELCIRGHIISVTYQGG